MKNKIVCVDAGHGGSNKGAPIVKGSNFNGTSIGWEKQLTLKLAWAIYQRFQTIKNISIVLSRPDDIYIPNKMRTHIAMMYRADLFVSLHYNSFTDETVGGCEAWYLHGCRDSQRCATKINARIVGDLGREDRGVKQQMPEDRRSKTLLPDTKIPAVLLEPEFISNVRGANWILKQSRKQELADMICRGIQEYF